MTDKKLETATFAAGCFWKPQEIFDNVDGVMESSVGYTGGHKNNPTYQQVCEKSTGHAEVVQVQFDPEKVSYDQLLETFFAIHDPTQVNRQGPDVGDQYRTEVFTHSEQQAEAARRAISDLDQSGKLRAPVATRVTTATDYWPAEEYHQKFNEKRRSGLLNRLFG